MRRKTDRNVPSFGLLGWMIGVGLLLFTACSSDYTPKPTGHLAIQLPEPEYSTNDAYPQFGFDLSALAELAKVEQDSMEGEWFNIVYPSLNAQIYCSYLHVPKERLAEMEEDVRSFVVMHSQRAEKIEEYTYDNPERGVYGSLYKLKGRVPSPTQFVLTDSVNSFLRGALYFEEAVDPDSIAPILDYLNNDIEILIESFRWKK